MDEQSCEKCRFSRPKGDSATVRICKYNPPQIAVNVDDGDGSSYWPNVDAGEWCGQWKARGEDLKDESYTPEI